MTLLSMADDDGPPPSICQFRERPERRASLQAAIARAYSCRSATMWSRRAALRAGYRPKVIPTTAANPQARKIAHGLISMGQPAFQAIAIAAAAPSNTPISPPTEAK